MTCSIADVPPFHLNSRNNMLRAYAVRMIASPRTRHDWLVVLIQRVVIVIKVSFVRVAIVPAVPSLLFHYSPITAVEQVPPAVGLHRFLQALVLRFELAQHP